jgi:hypothetical protein
MSKRKRFLSPRFCSLERAGRGRALLLHRLVLLRWLMSGNANDKARRFVWGWPATRFRNFSRAQLIGFMKQLNVFELNAKDVKDHLPMDPQQEQAALADYAAAGIKLHAAGAIYFAKDEDADIRSKFEYCKRAGIGVIVAGDPRRKLCRESRSS